VLLVPANAHIDYSGSGWDCDFGYRQQVEHCAVDEAPGALPSTRKTTL
jgi:hypothetical protein